jgi:hypothetical protein
MSDNCLAAASRVRAPARMGRFSLAASRVSGNGLRWQRCRCCCRRQRQREALFVTGAQPTEGCGTFVAPGIDRDGEPPGGVHHRFIAASLIRSNLKDPFSMIDS